MRRIYSISERSWNVREKVEVFWGRLDYFRGIRSPSEAVEVFHGVDWDISEVSEKSGGDCVWPWRLPENSFSPESAVQ